MQSQGDDITRVEPVPGPTPCIGPANAPRLPRENEAMQPDSAANCRIHAVSSFLLDRDPLVLELASRLGGRDQVCESAIRGSSMSPAIPGRARLRVRLLAKQSCQAGDVVFYLSDEGFMVHRLVYQPRRCSAASYVLTFGDNCLAPDPPVKKDRIMGTVIAVQTATGWRPPGPPRSASVYHRLIRVVAYGVMVVTFWFSTSAARRLAILLAALESMGRAPAGRLLRRLHLISSKR